MASCDSGSVIHLLYLLSLGSSETVVVAMRVKRRQPKVGVIILTSIWNTKINNSAYRRINRENILNWQIKYLI
jgi:hypothetical protein